MAHLVEKDARHCTAQAVLARGVDQPVADRSDGCAEQDAREIPSDQGSDCERKRSGREGVHQQMPTTLVFSDSRFPAL